MELIQNKKDLGLKIYNNLEIFRGFFVYCYNFTFFMIEFLRKIKLIQNFSIIIPMHRIDFVKLCREKIERKEDSFILSEYFTKGKHKYVGSVEHRGLKIRKRKTFFSLNKNACLIKGNFREKGNLLYLETTIKGYSNTQVTIYISIILLALYYVGYNLFTSDEPLFSIIIALLIQFLMLFSIPYFVIRLRIKRMKATFEQDIYNWILK